VFDGLPTGATESLEYVSSSGSWTAFSSFGGSGLTHLSTLAYPDGHVEVFALHDDGTIWHNVSTTSSWGGWKSMGAVTGKFATGAAPILAGDGHADLFATDAAGGAWHNATGTSSPPVWGGWKAMGGGPIASRPMPARWGDGHVQVFARGTDDHLYTSDSASAGGDAGAAFSSFTVLNASQVIAGEPSVLVYPAYGPEIFARDGAGDVLHMWNDAGTWSAWSNDLGQVLASDPLAWIRPDGLGEVFGVDAAGNVVRSLHGVPTAWSAWSTIGKGFEACLGGTKLIDAGGPGPSTDGGGPVADGGGPVADGGHPVDAGVRRDGSPVDARAHRDGSPRDGGSASPDGGVSPS